MVAWRNRASEKGPQDSCERAVKVGDQNVDGNSRCIAGNGGGDTFGRK